ncbi:MAG: IS630 family transposase [Nitrosomonas sp.]|nr:IS630 family transposase [Nitrosomonas sp.]
MEAFLTPQQREALIREHRKERDRKRGDRIKVVLWSDEGVSQTEIAHRLFISFDAVHGYLTAYQDEEGRLIPNYKGAQPILNEAESNQLNTHLEEQTYTKTKDIQAHILKTFGKEMGLTTIRSWLRVNKFSYKKPVLCPKGVDTEKQQAFIEHYHKLMNEAAMTGDPVLFVDAVHPTQQTQATYGWFKKGKDKEIETTAGRKRVNLIGALNLEDMDLVRKDFETIDSPAVIIFFRKVEAAYPDARVIHLIVDRAGYNTSREVEEFLKISRIELHLLPPRSPNLNPIERLWKIMHEYVSHNRVHDNFKAFKKALNLFFDETMQNIKEELISRITDDFQIIKSSESG